MRLLKTVMVLVVVMGLILGSAIPALAAPENNKPPWAGVKMRIVRGEVTAVGADNITVQPRDGVPIQIFVEEDSKFKLPTWGRAVALEDIQPGMQVVALVYEKESKLYARRIAIIPGKPRYRHYVGEVTDYNVGDNITIQPREGDPVTFTIDPEKFKILPPGATVEEGKWVTVVSRRQSVDDELVAVAVWVHPVKLLAPEEFREQLRGRLRWMEMERLRFWELERITGIIANIDEANTSLTVGETVLDYNEGTIIILKGVIGLQTGQSATAFYEEQEGGTLLAKLILVKIAPPEVEETEEAE